MSCGEKFISRKMLLISFCIHLQSHGGCRIFNPDKWKPFHCSPTRQINLASLNETALFKYFVDETNIIPTSGFLLLLPS